MNTLEFLIDQDILEVAYKVFKRKLENGKDEKESFITMVKECILIHLSEFEVRGSAKVVNGVTKDLFETLHG